MHSCASSQVGMAISVRSYCILRPARCCRPKRASLSISSWRLFGGIAWPNASREVSDRTRPIVLASLIAPQRNCDGDMGTDIKLNQLGLNQDNMRLEVRHATRTHPFQHRNADRA